jgi:hypothetical protein
MKRVEDTPIDPEVAAALDAIDATLAGDPVDPAHAELAELALLLTAGRPQPDPSFADALDARVARRFAPAPPSPATATATARAKRRPWWRGPAVGSLAATAVVLGVALVVLAAGGGGASSSSESSSTAAAISASSSPAAPNRASSSPAAPNRASSSSYSGPTVAPLSAPPRHSASRAPVSNAGTLGPAATGAAAPTPPSTARKVIQSAQLSLTTPPSRIDAVAQEVFNVVGDQNGFVQRSNVTAGGAANSSAQFQLSVPSSNLSQTMAQLSQLKYATVSSRTDATQDVNDQYVGDARRLDDAKALRTALLKQLGAAVTATQIESLNQQIHDADQEISSDQGTVNNLNHQVDYSQIQVTINAALIAQARHHKSSGFTLGKAAHDAGRVLTVAAGVALIALAALVPAALLATLGWWVITAVRRRRREHALDLA